MKVVKGPVGKPAIGTGSYNIHGFRGSSKNSSQQGKGQTEARLRRRRRKREKKPD